MGNKFGDVFALFLWFQVTCFFWYFNNDLKQFIGIKCNSSTIEALIMLIMMVTYKVTTLLQFVFPLYILLDLLRLELHLDHKARMEPFYTRSPGKISSLVHLKLGTFSQATWYIFVQLSILE